MDKGTEIKLDNFAYHPGEMLEEKLQEMEMSVEIFAEQAHQKIQHVKKIIACKASVTPETAVAFEMVTGIPARLWLDLQHDYDNVMLKREKETWMSKFIHLSRRTAAVL